MAMAAIAEEQAYMTESDVERTEGSVTSSREKLKGDSKTKKMHLYKIDKSNKLFSDSEENPIMKIQTIGTNFDEMTDKTFKFK